MSAPRRICTITGSRAEYGLLRPTMRRLARTPGAALQVIATGTHLSPAFGHTVDDIRADEFTVDAEVDVVLDGDSHWATATSAGLAVTGMSGALRRLEPDIVLLLGDRYETLGAAMAAFLGRVPIAHIHGGEVTQGSLDDGLRHAVTKLARLHLVSTEEHRQRVLQLGEDPAMVHVVGAPGLENIAQLPLEDRTGLEQRLGIRLGDPVVLLTYHAATASDEDPVAGVDAILDALAAYPNATIIATGSNADTGGRTISNRLATVRDRWGSRLFVAATLGQIGYLSAMRHAAVVLGNSSSGLIEAPSLGVPTVNIGTRQAGRPRGPSVIDCTPEAEAIGRALQQALSPEFSKTASRRENPYAPAGMACSEKIVEHLMGVDLSVMRAPKPFVDMPVAASDDSRRAGGQQA